MVSGFSEIDWEWNDATDCHMESFDWVKLWDFFAAEIAMDFHRMFNISGIELSKGMTRRQLDGTFLAWHFLSETMVLFPISIFLHQFSAENHPKVGHFWVFARLLGSGVLVRNEARRPCFVCAPWFAVRHGFSGQGAGGVFGFSAVSFFRVRVCVDRFRTLWINKNAALAEESG